jgi:hypothetical protein
MEDVKISHRIAIVQVGAMIMQIRFLSCVLMMFALVPLVSWADARSKPSPSEQYPGPWLEVTQEVRDTLARHKVSACSEAAGRQSSYDPGEYLLYCTRDERHWTSWRVQPAADTVHGPGGLLEGIQLPESY